MIILLHLWEYFLYCTCSANSNALFNTLNKLSDFSIHLKHNDTFRHLTNSVHYTSNTLLNFSTPHIHNHTFAFHFYTNFLSASLFHFRHSYTLIFFLPSFPFPFSSSNHNFRLLLWLLLNEFLLLLFFSRLLSFKYI